MTNGIMLNWIPPVIGACVFIGTMSGIAGILPKTITPPIFLYIVGSVWIPYFAFLSFPQMGIGAKASFLLLYISILAATLLLFKKFHPEINWSEINILIFCGFISAIGNHCLFTAVNLAGKYSGFPLVAFSMQSIFALFVSMALMSGGNYGVKFSGWESLMANIMAMNFKHVLAMILGIASVVMFNFAGSIE